ncbi:dihydroneopterin aldolase family protein [Methanosarcinaceae archaeon]|nr:dihydroneopterin aldolase family protein [Methanosarcinaceae archaeon]MBQ3620548.1 dihydroneopterin aldolase family protein [Methanosarcinaceae archaeon]
MSPESLSDRDRALFEAGIKLGTLYHQFVGTPVNLKTAAAVETAMAQSISVQPFAESVSVHLDRDMIGNELDRTFGYTEVKGKMITAELKIRVGKCTVTAALALDGAMDYPLMKIIDISEE